MKNKFGAAFVFSVLLISVFGCSSYNPLAGNSDAPSNSNSKSANANKLSLTDRTIESTVGGTTTGVVECDELLEMISESSKNQDDDYVSKATREFFLNRIRDSVRKSLEENKTDKKQTAKNCTDYKKQLEKFKAEEDGGRKSEKK